jgi:uncharacterized protein (TIGR03086 family)
MDDFTLAEFDRAAAVADGVISAIKPEVLADPTPCAEWNVRQLVNHLITGNLLFISMVDGTPPPDRGQDHLADDPAGSWRESLDGLRRVFAADGALERLCASPFGQRPGRVLLGMRVNEMMVHSWDLAAATGQSTELDAELAADCLAGLRAAAVPRGAGAPFAPEQPAPDDATAADRLAAFTGRSV